MPSCQSSAARHPAPVVSLAAAERFAHEVFDRAGTASSLDSYIDANFLITDSADRRFVLKVANEMETREELELQQAMLERIAGRLPGIAPVQVAPLSPVQGDDGREHLARMVSFLDGDLLARHHHSATSQTWQGLGVLLARLGNALQDLRHPADNRTLRWDMTNPMWVTSSISAEWSQGQTSWVLAAAAGFSSQVAPRLSSLPWQLIHNDANEHNLIVRLDQGYPKVAGIFDFGDTVRSARVFELAVAGAYAAIGFPPGDELEAMPAMRRVAEMVAGYNEIQPLEDVELEVLFPALLMRLALSVTISSLDADMETDNAYVTVNQPGAWRGLESLIQVSPKDALDFFRQRLGRDVSNACTPTLNMQKEEILEERRRHTSRSLSISYSNPLTILKGRGSWLYDEKNRGYLDGVNNVCHVGHCHPKVVAAATQQIASLNTNTRYLHPNLALYAKRLTNLFPDPLSVCFFVNSGSEANELALRLARSATGRRNMITMEGGYHGNTSTLIDLSHYKHAGPGGQGPPNWVRTVPCPDAYRGLHRDANAAIQYAAHVADAAADFQPSAFLFEPLIGCGGQIVPPPGYLTAACEAARNAGAKIIADEVQVGFGRVGKHWWAHQLDDEAGGAHPDIVTLGKPIGNGHPMAAVVTTPEIAEAFADGMEYFNTFGGNPVSCAIGMAVLDVIEEEELLSNAVARGDQLLQGIREMSKEHAVIGDVRGVGLYLGAEFVRDTISRTPDADRLTAVLDHCRKAGVLFSSDGPDRNVLKIKPPIVWSEDEADLALAVLDQALKCTR